MVCRRGGVGAVMVGKGIRIDRSNACRSWVLTDLQPPWLWLRQSIGPVNRPHRHTGSDLTPPRSCPLPYQTDVDQSRVSHLPTPQSMAGCWLGLTPLARRAGVTIKRGAYRPPEAGKRSLGIWTYHTSPHLGDARRSKLERFRSQPTDRFAPVFWPRSKQKGLNPSFDRKGNCELIIKAPVKSNSVTASIIWIRDVVGVGYSKSVMPVRHKANANQSISRFVFASFRC